MTAEQQSGDRKGRNMRITDDLWNRNPVGRPENTIQGETWRFTLLTDRLIRMEYQEDGQFEDRPSQVVWNRYFETVPYRVTEKKQRMMRRAALNFIRNECMCHMMECRFPAMAFP